MSLILSFDYKTYAIELYDAPDFWSSWFIFLKNKQIQQDFFAQSKYFRYTYWLQLNTILFDDRDELEVPKSQPLAFSNLRQIIVLSDHPPAYMYDIVEEITLKMLR